MTSRRLGTLALATAVPLALIATPTVAAPLSAVTRAAAGPVAAATAAPAAGVLTGDAAQAGRSELGSRIGLALMPDTQFYSRYDTPDTGMQLTTRYGSNPFAEQARWIAENRDELAIPMAVHLGDVVDQAGVAQEWQSAAASLQLFHDADMPYSILAGNHDVPDAKGFDPAQDTGSDRTLDLGAQPYLDLMTDERRADRATFRGTDETGFAEYHVFEAEGQEFLQIAVSWWASPDVLEWVDGVLAEHPTLPAIISTHQNLDVEGDGATPKRPAYGEYLWDNLIEDNDQIFLVLSGHHHGATQEVRTNAAGHEVLSVLSDYQMSYQGGNGYMNLLELDLTDDRIDLATFSPWVPGKPRPTLNAFDVPVLDAPNQEWSLPFDFSERFAGFAPDFAAGSADEVDLTGRAEQLVLAGWQAPTATEHPPATSATDHPVVEGTVAHWRPGQSGFADGQAVPEGATIADAAGASPMTRRPLATDGVTGARVEDVRFSTDHHPLSSDAGSLVFENTDRSENRLSFFATAADGPANAVAFTEGYTFEAFVKIDPEWTTDNAWMGAVTRGGQRGDLPHGQAGEPEGPPATLAFSNLREFQWSTLAADGPEGGTSAWSHEIPRGQWMHVAVVNDPVTRTVTMYVEGAPVLRNEVDQVGLAHVDGEPWIIGAGSWEDEIVDGWLGAVGEVRLVDHALGADQWLTARAGDADGSDDAAGDIPVTAEIPGLPGGPGEPGEPGQPGSLVLTVTPGTAQLDDARNRGDRLALSGDLPGVTVTDSRPNGEWTVTGRSSDLTGDATAQGATVRADDLGWQPYVASAGETATTARPGPAVAPRLAGGPDLATPAELATGGTGSTTIGADLDLQVPVDTKAGAYTGAMTVSLFPQD